jgi:hypothetical protein
MMFCLPRERKSRDVQDGHLLETGRRRSWSRPQEGSEMK